MKVLKPPQKIYSCYGFFYLNPNWGCNLQLSGFFFFLYNFPENVSPLLGENSLTPDVNKETTTRTFDSLLETAANM